MNLEPEHDLPPDFLSRLDPLAFSAPELIALAVAEKGSPMTLEDAAARLRDLGVVRTVQSLRKAWHAFPCLRKRGDGRLEVVPGGGPWCPWTLLLVKVRRRLAPGGAERAPGPGKKDAPPIDDRSPVTLDEVRRGLGAGYLSSLSPRRIAALLAEASGGKLDLSGAARLLEEIGLHIKEEHLLGSIRGAPGPVVIEEDDRLVHSPDHPSLVVARRILRGRLAELDARDAARTRAQELAAACVARRQHVAEQARREFPAARKAVLRCAIDGDAVAASILDPDRREFEDFGDLPALRSRLADAGVILGLDPRSDLERIGFDPGSRRVVDLSPPVKTLRLNRRGRTLKVTPSMVLRSTLGISSPLGEPARLKLYFRAGDRGKLFRRLHADLKALWRLYEYGCLHGHVRLQWGFLDKLLRSGWNVGELPDLHEICLEASRGGKLVEIVLGSAPGWEDPWSRALRARVLDVEHTGVVVELLDSSERRRLSDDEIQAIRLVPEEPGAGPPES